MGWVTALATIAGVASAVAAAVGLVFAGWQLRIVHNDREEDHRVAREGVAVSWQPVLAGQNQVHVGLWLVALGSD